jgi:hypothetical protein
MAWAGTHASLTAHTRHLAEEGTPDASSMHLGAAVRLDASIKQRGLDMAGNAQHWSHATTFEATPISASEARAFVSHRLLGHRLVHLTDPVRLVASELATNALVHAQTACSVTLSADDHAVMLTVRTTPPRFPPDVPPGHGCQRPRTSHCGHREYRLGRQQERNRPQSRLGMLRHRLISG